MSRNKIKYLKTREEINNKSRPIDDSEIEVIRHILLSSYN